MDQLVTRKNGKSIAIHRYQLNVQGIVQGVGFRPFIYRLANRLGLSGSVVNELGKVSIEVEGTEEQIILFLDSIQKQATPPIRVDSITRKRLNPTGEQGFNIRESAQSGSSSYFVIPPDLAICPQCRNEVMNHGNRYYQYPFTSCTQCGPRYTITHSFPYDRKHTSLAQFPLCIDCKQEYADPLKRRYHAQAIACPQCGPQVTLVDQHFKQVSSPWLPSLHATLHKGKIIAVKGIGGFHLVCDASQKQVVEKLRTRKNRPRKPLAIMVGNIEQVEKFFELSPGERKELTGREAPIILLKPKAELAMMVDQNILAPGMNRLGVMLPYTPLHQLMFAEQLSFLVATSGNKGGQPIVRTNEDAHRDLQGIADYYLLHDREIIIRADDSVGQVINEQFCLIRRSRGFVPEALAIPIPKPPVKFPVIFACGGEMKNTFCIIHEQRAFLSHHLGDLDSIEGMENYRQAIEHICQLLQIEPQIIAYDPHPNYVLSREIQKMKLESSKVYYPVFHHHAHMVSCMAEHGLTESVIACILDGTGYGRDGNIWGFEILAGDYIDFERIYHIQPITLPGGEAAIRYPWMMTASLIYEALQDQFKTLEWLNKLFPAYQKQFSLLLAQLQGNIPSPKVSSAGRLFDAVSALLGLCSESSYEGEAAILLGEQVDESLYRGSSYPFDREQGEWKVSRLIKTIMEEYEKGVSTTEIAVKFHNTITEMIVQGVRVASNKTGIQEVVLSGGVFHNRYLLSYTVQRLEEEGFRVYTHQKISAGDGGIALGQAVSALWRWHREYVSICSSQSD